MQQLVETAPSSASTNFASLLAALAAPAQKSAPAWNDDDLADDVATLSYERALRSHARYRADSPSDFQSDETSDLGPLTYPEASATEVAPTPQATVCRSPRKSIDTEQPVAARRPSTQFERNLKSASITIRMSKTECEQLQKRAAEAGLTVSAYLRSCTFEAESLRALVKDTMAQLKTATADEKKPVPVPAAAPVRRSWLQWLKQSFVPWHGTNRRMVHA